MSKQLLGGYFFDLYSQGKVLAEQIDDFIDNWHNGIAGKRQPLHKYLGLSQEAFNLWVQDANALPHILSSRHKDYMLTKSQKRKDIAF